MSNLNYKFTITEAGMQAFINAEQQKIKIKFTHLQLGEGENKKGYDLPASTKFTGATSATELKSKKAELPLEKFQEIYNGRGLSFAVRDLSTTAEYEVWELGLVVENAKNEKIIFALASSKDLPQKIALKLPGVDLLLNSSFLVNTTKNFKFDHTANYFLPSATTEKEGGVTLTTNTEFKKQELDKVPTFNTMISIIEENAPLLAMPIGSMIMWPGKTPPPGWLICDGSTINFYDNHMQKLTDLMPEMEKIYNLEETTNFITKNNKSDADIRVLWDMAKLYTKNLPDFQGFKVLLNQDSNSYMRYILPIYFSYIYYRVIFRRFKNLWVSYQINKNVPDLFKKILSSNKRFDSRILNYSRRILDPNYGPFGSQQGSTMVYGTIQNLKAQGINIEFTELGQKIIDVLMPTVNLDYLKSLMPSYIALPDFRGRYPKGASSDAELLKVGAKFNGVTLKSSIKSNPTGAGGYILRHYSLSGQSSFDVARIGVNYIIKYR